MTPQLVCRFLMLVVLAGFFLRIHLATTFASVPPAALWLIGVLSDLAAGWLLLLPAVVITPWSRVAGRWVFRIMIGVVVLISCAEVFYWHEFDGRLDRLVFHYLRYPVEVATFLEEQFAITLILIPFLAVCAALVWLAERGMGQHDAALPRSTGRLGAAVTAYALVGALLLVYIDVPVSGGSRRFDQFATNGYVGVLSAARFDETDWAGNYAATPAAPASAPVPGACTSDTPAVKARHVVLIVEESFSGPAVLDDAQRKRDLPAFDAVVNDALYLSNIYSTGSRTTRGLEALLNGFPPLPGIAVNQREGVERLPSLPRAFASDGFHTVFAYGGWPDFSNFFSYWSRIGFAEMTSRDDFPSPGFETSWGVADDELFERILTLMDARTQDYKRVFLATLTVSNHRPFEVPDAADTRSQLGALRFAGSALRTFLQAARTRPWYNDTLFVIAADHGPRIVGDANVPFEGFRVPLLMAGAPVAHLAGARMASLGSLMSVPCTLTTALAIKHQEPFWGANLLEARDSVVPLEYNYHIAVLNASGLVEVPRIRSALLWPTANASSGNSAGTSAVQAAIALFAGAHASYYNTSQRVRAPDGS